MRESSFNVRAAFSLVVFVSGEGVEHDEIMDRIDPIGEEEEKHYGDTCIQDERRNSK